jgi:hypothetical protein
MATTKLQKPSIKSQTNSNSQIAIFWKPFEISTLEFIWYLDFGAWNFAEYREFAKINY